MSTVTANGSAVQSMTLRLQARGLWSADLVVDADRADEVTGKVEIKAGSSTWVGTALRPGADPGGQVTLRVLGGAGRLTDEIGPASYHSAPIVREIVEAILQPLGEKLSKKSDSTIIGRSLPRWSREAGKAFSALDALTTSLGCTWRVLDDGSVWIGTDTFAALDADVTVTSERPELGMVEVDDDAFVLRPGRKLGERKLYAVEYEVAKKTRAVLTTVEGGSPQQRAEDAKMKRGLAKAGLTFAKTFRGRVTSQNADQTVEVRIEPGLPIASMSRVPLRHGLPGITELRLEKGAEVLIGFDDGDAQRPFAALPLKGGRLLHLVVDGDSFELGGTEPVALAALTDDRFSALEDRVAALETWGGSVSPAFPGGPGSGGSSVAATKLKTE